MNALRVIMSLVAGCVFSAAIVAQQASLNNSEVHAHAANSHYEPTLLAVIESLKLGQLDDALSLVDGHLIKFPKSREAHILRADILKAMTSPLVDVANDKSVDKDELVKFKHQLNNRWQHLVKIGDKAHTHFPSPLVELGSHEYVLVADMTGGRLYLYANEAGQPKLVRDYYLSIGSAGFGKEVEGDNKTPVGVYEVNRYIEGKALPDLYGKGAFPVNYPNRFDRSRKRTGYGIWLHGTPSDTYARSPWASEGCFVLSNDDLLDIGQYISPEKRTPVILSDHIEWLSVTQLQTQKQRYYALINEWKKDWESLNLEAYLQHYSREYFNLGQGGYTPWVERKNRVNNGKTFVQVDLELQSLFLYPGEKDMFVVRYKQRYLSNNYSGEANKEQYWQRNADGKWKIIFEG